MKSELESTKSKMAQNAAGDLMNQVTEVKGVKLLAAKVEGVDMNKLRELGDSLEGEAGRRRARPCVCGKRQGEFGCNGI